MYDDVVSLLFDERSGIVGFGEKAVYVLPSASYEYLGFFQGREIVVVGELPRPLVYVGSSPSMTAVYTDKIVGGMSIGIYNVLTGTLGMVVRGLDDRLYGISNAHVVAVNPFTDECMGTAIVSPGPADAPNGRIIGRTEWYSVLKGGESTCALSRAIVKFMNAVSSVLGRKTRFKTVVAEANTADYGVIRIADDVYADTVPGKIYVGGRYVEPRKIYGLLFAGSSNVYFATPVSVMQQLYRLDYGNAKLVDPVVGEKIMKCGRTTGCTEGRIIDRNVTVKVRYGDKIVLFTGVFAVAGKSAPGDSGSLVFAT